MVTGPGGARHRAGVPLALAALTLLLHLATNGGYNYFRDELYYIACGEHLAWGYVNHPPLVAVVARASRALFGDSLRGLRFFPALAGAATVLLAGLIARDLGGGRFAQAIAGMTALIAPIYLLGFSILTMNAFEIVLWTLLAFVLLRILAGGDRRLWLVFGAIAGVSLLNKHSTLFLLAGVFIGLVLTPARRDLATPWPYLGGLLALALFAPHVAWQVENGWPTLEFMDNARRLKNFPISPLGFLAGQVLLIHPVSLPIWLAGLGFYLFAERGRRHRPLGWAYLFLLALFVATRAKVYYLAPAYPMLLGAGGVALERALASRPRRAWLRAAALAALVAGGAVLAPLMLPVLPPPAHVAYARFLHVAEPPQERHQAAALPQVFADMFGWEEMVARVARAYHALPPEEQAQCAIFASNYGEAGAIDFYGRRYGLPGPVSGHNTYWLWGPGEGRGEVAITVGESREDVEETYRDVVEVDRTASPWAMPYENDLPIFVARGPKASLREIWPRCKKFI